MKRVVVRRRKKGGGFRRFVETVESHRKHFFNKMDEINQKETIPYDFNMPMRGKKKLLDDEEDDD